MEFRGAVPKDLNEFVMRVAGFRGSRWNKSRIVREALLLWLQQPENARIVENSGLIEQARRDGLDLSFLEGTTLENKDSENSSD